jgi:phosphoribosyl-AMP cyclohydrolase
MANDQRAGNDWLDKIRWNADGLVPVIAQSETDGQVLMLAWMSREALARTVACGQAVYWSRSRQRLWRKGESSGHVQVVKDIRLDCDRDALLLSVAQHGGIACHTGRRTCFYRQLHDHDWICADPVLENPRTINA